MLLILIPIGWLAIVAFFVILCQAAARGDQAMLATSPRRPTRTRAGLTVLEGRGGLSSPRAQSAAALTTLAGPRVRTRGPAHGMRARRLRCVR
jgi:hypothetical protein